MNRTLGAIETVFGEVRQVATSLPAASTQLAANSDEISRGAQQQAASLEESLSQIQAGHSLVGESGRALNDIIVSVKRVTEIVAEIASVSREQSIGVEKVNQAVGQWIRSLRRALRRPTSCHTPRRRWQRMQTG